MGQLGPVNTPAVNTVFREPVHQVLEKIKNEPFFKWPNKMAGDPTKRNQNLYCHYHQEQGHTTENCRNLWDHLDQLVGEKKLKSLLHHSSGKGNQTNSNSRKNATYGPPLETINVIFAAPGRTRSCPSRMMSVARVSSEEGVLESKRAKIQIQPTLGFLDEDKASGPNGLYIPINKLRGENRHSERSDQTTHTNRLGGSGGGFYCGRFIFPLYSHCGQAMASCFGGYLLYPASKGEISL